MKYRRNRGIRAVVWVALFSMLALGCSRSSVTGKRQFIAISQQQEIAMGREAAPKFEAEFGGKVPNAELQAYVSEIGQKVAAKSPRKGIPYEFALLASNVPNAFALPGGKIYVTSGLMSRMGSERELAAVLGHEITHVADQHGVKGMQRQMGAEILVAIVSKAAGPDKAQAAEAAAKIAASMATLSYSRDQEIMSDSYGTRYIALAGYSPWGMVELLETLKGLGEKDPGLLERMFLTHPPSSERIENATRILQREYPNASRAKPDPNTARFLQKRRLLPGG